MGARPNPLMAIITTAGFNMICPCIDEYLYCSKILDPNNPMQNDEYLVIICELDEGDDITKPNTWIKANPILCSYKEGRAYIKSRLKKALDEPTKMRDFLTKNMNKWVNMIENGYMDMEKWAKVAKKMKIQDMAGLKCICGIDLSSTTDLTSISFLFYVNGVYRLFNHSFMPKNKLVEATRRDKVPYDLWNKYGYITLTEGDVVDYDYIHEYMNKIRNMGIDIIEVVYDPYNSSQFITKLMMDDFICVEARQRIMTLGTPTKEFRDSVYNRSLEHEDNPCLTWATGNALLRFDGGGNFIIMKRNRNAIQRIDPTASAINAFLRRESLENHIEDLYKVIELG